MVYELECYNDFSLIYDKLLSEDIDYKKWADFILNLSDEYDIKKDSYLDIACGTGNISSELGSVFNETWGVDLSEDMLSIADKKFRSKGIKARLICEDMCNLNLRKQFDLVTCALDSVNYILDTGDLMKFLSGVYTHLKPHGLFVFDMNSYYKISEVLGSNTYNYDSDEIVYIWDNFYENEIVDMYLTFFVKKGELYRRFDEIHRERAYSLEFMDRCIDSCKLKILKRLDNYEPKNVEDYTERVTYVVTRD